jgi:hypothetical protein
MKGQMKWLWRSMGVLAGVLLLLGCGGKTASASKLEKAVEADPPVGVESLTETKEAETNEAALDREPTQKIEPAPFQTSLGVADVIKLAESGVGEEVILAFIQNSPIAYNLSVEEILYLNDLGISVPVIAAMIHRGNVLRENETRLAAQEATMDAAVATVKKALAEGKSQDEITPQPTSQAPVASAPTPTAEAPEYAGTPPASYYPVPAPDYLNVPTQVNYFYSSLSPYGSWMELPDYGWCWQPTTVVIDRGWRPYCHRGSWMYSNCGWYWHSDYSWGWAPFHYGRWYDHPGRGWVWFPDKTWAPAWVSWRNTDTHCGWAPLPPGAHCGPNGWSFHGNSVGVGFGFGLGAFQFNFVSYKDFGSRYPQHHALKGPYAQTVYTKSKPINGIVMGDNNTIINNGVGYERVAAASRSEIRKVVIKDAPTTPSRVSKPDRLERYGSDVVVYRTQIEKPASANNDRVASRLGEEIRKDSIRPAFPSGAAPNANRPAASQSFMEVSRASSSSGPPRILKPSPIERDGAGTTANGVTPSRAVAERPPARPSLSQQRGLQSSNPSTPASAPPGSYQIQSTRSEPQRAAMNPTLIKPTAERGIQSPASRSTPNTPTPYSASQTIATLPTPPQRITSPVRTPQVQIPQQPQIITPSYRQQVQQPAPTYAQPQIIPQRTYQAPRPTSVAPQPVIRQDVQPQYRAPAAVQPAYRTVPIQAPSPARMEAPRPSPPVAQPQRAAPVVRQSAPSSSQRRDNK